LFPGSHMPLDMNYFNYFTEIEDEFVRRRGSHMWVSPLDWALVENWKQRGIPLHIVLRGINSSFDGYDRRKHRGRKVSTLFFCRQEVEAMFEEYSESRVGDAAPEAAAANGAGQDPFGAAQLIAFLRAHCETLERLRDREAESSVLRDTFARTCERLVQLAESLEEGANPSPELLETDLTMIEEVILDGLKEAAGADRLGELRKEGRQQLRAYKQTMERAIYEQTLSNFLARRLREEAAVPRLSLFYL
jgi:hypothetical protein